MNVFVLTTGRSGSLTFAEACRHITNFSCGHETRVGLIGAERLAYPDQHIEVDNRLAWFTGRLERRLRRRRLLCPPPTRRRSHRGQPRAALEQAGDALIPQRHPLGCRP